MNMKIIITEQQYSKILDTYKDLIEKVLHQKNIFFDKITIDPVYFPERGLKINVKLRFKEDKNLANKLVKGILNYLTSFGPNKSINITS